jgi:hypothetical protein
MGWAAIGGALMGVGALAGISLGVWGAGSHLWSDDYFWAGFLAALILAPLGFYVLIAEFIGNIGPITLRLPATRYEREAKRVASEGGLRIVTPPRPAVPQPGEVRTGNTYARTDFAPSRQSDQTVPLRQPDQRSRRGRLEAHAERGKEILARVDKALEKYSTSLGGSGLLGGVGDVLGSVQVQGSLLVTERDGWIATATGLVERLAPQLLAEYNTDYVVGEPTVPALGAIFHRLREPLRQRLDGLQRVIDAMEDSAQSLGTQKSKEPVSPEHRDTLKSVAGSLLSCLRASQTAYYGKKGDERKAQAFQEHFPDVTGRVTAWNEQIAALETERRELQEWVEQRLRTLAYDQPPFAWGYAGLIAELAAIDGADLAFEVPQIEPLWLQLGPYPVVPASPPNGRTREDIEIELRSLLSEARQQPQCERTRQIRGSLAEASKPLISDLDLIQAKDVINGLGDCELCR